jgi:hypothetical protein
MTMTMTALLAGFALSATPTGEGLGTTMRNEMKNCPTSVTGAKSTIKNTKKGYEMNISAPDAEARKEIQARAHKLVTMASQPDDPTIQHTGQGTGGSRMGWCPVVQQGTKILAKDTKDGVRLTVELDTTKAVGELQKSAEFRLAKGPTPPTPTGTGTTPTPVQ